MNWRPFVFSKLTTTPAITSLIPASSVYAGGSMTAPPEVRPFIIYRLGAEVPRIKDDMRAIRTAVPASVWVYDSPGSYSNIDEIIRQVRTALVGQVPLPGATACEWLGDSDELADPEWNTIMRNATFNLIGTGT